MGQSKIRLTIELENSQGFSTRDSVEELYPYDLSKDDLEPAVRQIVRGFSNMMEVLRRNHAQLEREKKPKPASGGDRGKAGKALLVVSILGFSLLGLQPRANAAWQQERDAAYFGRQASTQNQDQNEARVTFALHPNPASPSVSRTPYRHRAEP